MIKSSVAFAAVAFAQTPLALFGADDAGAVLGEVLAGRAPSYQDLSKLSYLSMVIRESMRLYPPIWVMERRALEDDIIEGFRIPAGSPTMASAPPFFSL